MNNQLQKVFRIPHRLRNSMSKGHERVTGIRRFGNRMIGKWKNRCPGRHYSHKPNSNSSEDVVKTEKSRGLAFRAPIGFEKKWKTTEWK